MSEGPETRLTLLVLWIGRVVWVISLLLLVAAAIAFAIRVHRYLWSWFPKPSDLDEPVSENPISS